MIFALWKLLCDTLAGRIAALTELTGTTQDQYLPHLLQCEKMCFSKICCMDFPVVAVLLGKVSGSPEMLLEGKFIDAAPVLG